MPVRGQRWRPTLEVLEDRQCPSALFPHLTIGHHGTPLLVANAAAAPDPWLPFVPLASRSDVSVYVYKQAWAPGLNRPVDLRLYVHYPPGFIPGRSDPRPALIFFHSGGWTAGDPTLWFPESLYFASRGMVTISVQYRLRAVDGGSYTDSIANAIADAKSAVRWVRKYAAALGVNPNQVAAAGDSAGGHVALATATVPGFDSEAGGPDAAISSSPNLILVAYPVADTVVDERLSPYAFLNGANLPPTLYLQGTADTWTPYDTAVRFCEKTNALAGHAVCEFVALAGAEHAFLGTARFYRPALLAMDQFLVAHGWLVGGRGDMAGIIQNAELVRRASFIQWARENGYTGNDLYPGGVW
jgi:acetyl esterase/lipase